MVLNPLELPENLPPPPHDFRADHLKGMRVADVALDATRGPAISLAKLPGRSVVYFYPRTGVPGVEMPNGWDAIPGARGCTPQSCGFRDHFADLQKLGVRQMFGVSTQETAYQREAAQRLHLPFALLSDVKLSLAMAMKLPTMDVEGATLLSRMAWIVDDGVITHVFYPVFPPDKNAQDVIDWLRGNPGA